MKNKELAKKLLKNPENEAWCGAWNGYVDTYAVVDHVLDLEYDKVINDFFGTPGRIDKRVLEQKEENITFIGTRFGKTPNPDIDFGSDDIDYPLKTLNGEKGDPNLVWHLNHFRSLTREVWTREDKTEGWEIKYDTTTEILEVNNYRGQMYFKGKVIGIETLRNLIETCKINLNIWT